MAIFVGIVGCLAALNLFIASIILFVQKLVLLGIVCLFLMCYDVSVMVMLIRADYVSSKNETELKRLREDVKMLKQQLGITLSDEDVEDEEWSEDDGKWEQNEDGTWQFTADGNADGQSDEQI